MTPEDLFIQKVRTDLIEVTHKRSTVILDVEYNAHLETLRGNKDAAMALLDCPTTFYNLKHKVCIMFTSTNTSL